MAHLEDLTSHPGIRQLFELAERHCVYGCCGLDAFDGDESSWDEEIRASYTALVQSADAPALVAAIDEVLRVLTLDGHLDSDHLNDSIALDTVEGQEVVSYLRRARARAAAGG